MRTWRRPRGCWKAWASAPRGWYPTCPKDRRVESALLFNFPEVNAIVYNGGNGTQWEMPRVERIITATPELAELLGGPLMIGAGNVVGVTNQQGASRMRSLVY